MSSGKSIIINFIIFFSTLLMSGGTASAQKSGNAKQAQFTVIVGSEIKQKMRFGVDAIRLWYWRSSLKDQLAQFAVGDMKSEYVRVAINCAYEREQGVKKDSAYDIIVEVMTAMKKANPQIKFFASPEALGEAYTAEEQLAIFGATDGCPWAPYPGWIMGFNGYGGIFGGDGFNVNEALQYLADYLNLMYSKGFLIDFLDLTQEKEIITPAICNYIYNNLPSKLNSGVKVPLLVVPSSWSCYHATEWLKTVDVTKNEQNAFGIAATHNTSLLGSPLEFATAASALGKEAWNTELHGWLGTETELHEEIMTSSYLWDYINAGFSGIETWLFFGPSGGKGHTMIWSGNTSIQKSAKYEIFKRVVNAANGGNYIPSEITSSDSVTTTFFVKDGIYSGSILNTRHSSLGEVTFELPVSITGMNVEVTTWNESLPRSGKTSYFSVTGDKSFSYSIDGESLYFFKISHDSIPTVMNGDQIMIHFENNDATQVNIAGSATNQNPTPTIVANPYKNGLNLSDSCLYTRSVKDLTASPKIPAWSQNSITFTFEEPLIITDDNRYFHVFNWKGQKLNSWLVYATQNGTDFLEIKRNPCPAAQTWFDIVADVKSVFSSIKAIRIYLDGNWSGADDVRYYEPTDFYYDEIAFMDNAEPRSAPTSVITNTMGKTYSYPNPVKEYLNFKSEFPLREISVRGLDGKLIISESADNLTTGKTYVGHLNNGFYILELTGLNNKKHFLKFIKQ